MSPKCSVCASGELHAFTRFDGLPALANALWPTREEALVAARGDVELALCERCGMIENTVFDVGVFGYSPAYENALHFSATFREFAAGVAKRLVDRYDLNGSQILEIGPGDGDFLQQLCDLGGSTGVGFDPSFPDDVPRVRDLSDRVQVRREHFPLDGQIAADFVCSRHVLEHVPDPSPMVESMHRAVAARSGAVYVEVPDAAYMLDELALWDLIYEHCLYYTPEGLRSLLTEQGFEVAEMASGFGGQFLWAEGVSLPIPKPLLPSSSEIEALSASTRSFHERATALVKTANARLAELAELGPVALWGAGSKGVSFLNMTDGATATDIVVDINPRKHGKFVPVSGQEVVGPERLRDDPPASVIVLNPNYVDEIGNQLAELGVQATIEVVTPQ